MKNVIILHGQPDEAEYYDPSMPSMSNAHWIPWLQGQLLKNNIVAATPEVPYAYKPEWELWKREVERYDITADTLVVGHSRGGDFWLRWLSEHPNVRVGKVVLVAPSIGYLTKDRNYFGEYLLDRNLVQRTNGITVFSSDDDAANIIVSVSEIVTHIDSVNVKEFHLGHFTSDSMGSTEFPELLAELLR